jgi:hypothetical protein
MKALRVKFFGKYITRLPDFVLNRHEDIPLPVSSACHHSEVEAYPIEFKRFVPSQDLSGPMIPMTGQETAKSKSRKRLEQELLFAEYQKRLSGTSQSELASDECNVEKGIELFASEDRVVCYVDECSELDTLNKHSENAPQDSITATNANCKAIQLTMGNQMVTPAIATSSKWVFSASIQFSLKREPIASSHVALLHDDASLNHRRIEEKDNDIDDDVVDEEGVEIVPLSISNDDIITESDQTPLNDDGDNDAVVYVKESTSGKSYEDISSGDQVSPRDPLDAID